MGGPGANGYSPPIIIIMFNLTICMEAARLARDTYLQYLDKGVNVDYQTEAGYDGVRTTQFRLEACRAVMCVHGMYMYLI